MRRAAPALALLVALGSCCGSRARASEIHVTSFVYPRYTLFLDPDPYVVTKEFAFTYNSVLDTTEGKYLWRDFFHLFYQRGGGPQKPETMLGHAWSSDLVHWVVDTSAFRVDTTSWNTAHVWSPSIVQHGSRTYMFYTGVDAQNDQRIGYVSTALLDTSDTVWDSPRVKVWEAGDTKWAVPDPSIYSGQTQCRDPYVIHDPEDPERLLMFYAAHDSLDFKANRGGLAVGVARSAPGSVDVWEDLGFYPGTLRQVTGVAQLEGPHVFSAHGSSTGWRLMFSSAGTPPGETGQTTLRFESLAPQASLSDTTPGHWGPPTVLKQYLNGDATVFGWSGSEGLDVGGVDFLAGFTAWGPAFQGIAITRLYWNGNDFTVGSPAVAAVDEYRSLARGVSMRVAEYSPGAPRVTFLFDSPLELEARFEIFDAMGRRLGSLLDGRLRKGSSSVVWDLSASERARVPSGVYFARLCFAGGLRVARVPVTR